jgi:hypothetical protein
MIYKINVKGTKRIFRIDANNPDQAVHLFTQDYLIVNKENNSWRKYESEGAKPSIQTADGEKKYYKTEIEDGWGRWNDNYWIRDGFWVTHHGKYHHVYH